MTAILEKRGWEAILPRSLSDSQLVRLADQLRGFLWDEGALRPDEDPNAAIELALLLLARVNPSLFPLDEEFPWDGKRALLRDVLLMLHMEASREIVIRTLTWSSDEESSETLTKISIAMGLNFRGPASAQSAKKSRKLASTIGAKSPEVRNASVAFERKAPTAMNSAIARAREA